MFILTKKTQIKGNGVIGLEHSKMQKILPKKNKRRKIRYVPIASNNFSYTKNLKEKTK
jgi:hypothetical protein